MTPDERLAIWERDRRRCGICGQPVDMADLEIDHVRPRMVGGVSAPANLRATHYLCNRRRAAADRVRYPRAVRARFAVAPTVPDYDLEPVDAVSVSQVMRRAAAMRRRADRPCASCGRTIIGAFGRRLYCSATCKQRAWRQRRPAPPTAAPRSEHG
jgi:hypothetical protein